MTPTDLPRPICPACREYPVADLSETCAMCVHAEANGVTREPRPTVRVTPAPCGRPHLAGEGPCAGCAAPQWVDWPTHAGWWWFSADGSRPILVEVDDALDFFDTRRQHLDWRFGDERDWYANQHLKFRFLDARLTPPATPRDL